MDDFVHKNKGSHTSHREKPCFFRVNPAPSMTSQYAPKTGKKPLFRNHTQQLLVIGQSLEDFLDTILFQGSHAIPDSLGFDF